MKTVRGHFDGNVVVLDEPAPISHAIPVTVTFPDEMQPDKEPDKENAAIPSCFSWERTRKVKDGYEGSVADELIRQRRVD